MFYYTYNIDLLHRGLFQYNAAILPLYVLPL